MLDVIIGLSFFDLFSSANPFDELIKEIISKIAPKESNCYEMNVFLLIEFRKEVTCGLYEPCPGLFLFKKN